MRDIGMLMCCYGQPNMMAAQKAAWDAYPKEFQERLQIIVIDDCGTPAFTCDEELPYELIILRVDKNIPWNQPGAKNLGFQQATVPWIINMDPDMVFTNLAIEQILQQMPDVLRRGNEHYYKFGLNHLTDPKKPMDHSSPNFYMIHKDKFWKTGGYNEDFSGHKGFSDVVLHRMLGAKKRILWQISADFYHHTYIDDAMVTSLDRNYDHNGALFKKTQEFCARRGWNAYPATYQSRGYVRFPWSKIR